MGKIKILEEFKKDFNVEISRYLDTVIDDVRKRDGIMTEAVKYVKKIALAGGKRLRPAFMYYGYIASGGKEKIEMIRTSVSIELIHLFLLIHDDIIDHDQKRHGLDSVNFYYSKIGKRFFKNDDSNHFGNSIAIIVGDMVNALGNQIIFSSKFPPENIMKALNQLQSIIFSTVIGQSQDIYIEYRKSATEKEVLKMYENKTSRYTVDGPLRLGATLGGANQEIIEGLSYYAVPLGIAFQIQDDILGVFSSEKKLGKDVGSDIAEGKQTILVVKAKEKANKRQKYFLNKVLGKRNLSKEDIKNFQKIIIETGSLEYAKELAKKNVIKAKKEILKVKIEKEAKDFLLQVADFMIEREF